MGLVFICKKNTFTGEVMSKLLLGIRSYLIFFRWVILLILFLIHVKWDQVYSFGYTLLITFNLIFTFLNFYKCKSAVWKVSLLIEVVTILLINGIFPPRIDQLFYVYSSFLLIGIVFSRIKALLLNFTYSIVASLLMYKLYQSHIVVGSLYPLSFLCGFILYLLLVYLMENILIFIKKWMILLRYVETLSKINTFRGLHNKTENYIKKLFVIPKCYLCMYSNTIVIDDWYNQYYTRVLQSNSISDTEKKRRVIKLDNYLGEQEIFLFIPLRLYRSNQNLGGLLLSMEKRPYLDRFDLVLLRILLSSFLNQWHLLILLQEQANSMKAEVRSKLAQDIHDGLAQQLFFLSAQIFQMKNSISKGNTDQLDHMIKMMEQQATACQNEVREFIAHLKGERRDSNIYDAIQQLIKKLTYNNPVKIIFEKKGEFIQESIEIEETIYQLIEEAINNALKHADANTINVMVESTIAQWTIKIMDDGIGFDSTTVNKQNSHSYGLKGLNERVVTLGGHISLNSQVGIGTEVVAVIPRGGMNLYV